MDRTPAENVAQGNQSQGKKKCLQPLQQQGDQPGNHNADLQLYGAITESFAKQEVQDWYRQQSAQDAK